MRSQFYTTLLLAFAIQLDYFILHADAEDLKKPEISVQNSGGEVDLSCQTKLEHLPSDTNVTCNLYIGDSSQPFRSTWTKNQVCFFVVKRDDLKQGLQSVGATEVSCDYSVPTDPRSPSPRSDKIKIEGLSPGTSTFSVADKKTTSPPPVTTKQSGKVTSQPPQTPAQQTAELPTEPRTEPPTVPPIEPPTEPRTVPTTELRTVPTTAPPIEPPTVPPIEPPTEPPTEPRTVPPTEPRMVPPTEPRTVSTTEPGTVSTTEPRTLPTTEPNSARFLWRHILSALVLLAAIGILIEYFISHTPTTGLCLNCPPIISQ
ncbi:uncharacterized protein LOC135240051 isoform X8 [Anguilla rostrata]|uniref:uncharacterized protein LOC135240051 isoform X8 n=1 Tax=Anguilla rostrata TaxID=7938 RepID=UPI0030D1802C